MPQLAHPLSGRRILIVEDEYLIASEIKRWLLVAGAAAIGPVPSVDRALDLIKDDRPDAAVLDIRLGEDDAVYPVADKLGVLKVPYLFATGDIRRADTSAYQHQVRLEKPFMETKLVQAFADLIT